MKSLDLAMLTLIWGVCSGTQHQQVGRNVIPELMKDMAARAEGGMSTSPRFCLESNSWIKLLYKGVETESKNMENGATGIRRRAGGDRR
jgi:hypothetical protein